MKNTFKITAPEYLQHQLRDTNPSIELLPIFKMHFSRLIDPTIVSIGLNEEGIVITQQIESDPDYGFSTVLSKKQYDHFYTKDKSSKKILDAIIFDNDFAQYEYLSESIRLLDAYLIQTYQLFGDFQLGYDLIKDQQHIYNLEKELDDKLNQLSQSVEISIDFAFFLRLNLIDECANNTISKLKKEPANSEKFSSLYEELIHEYQNLDLFNQIRFPDEFCDESISELSETKLKAIEYGFADIKRIDVRQNESHYESYIHDQFEYYDNDVLKSDSAEIDFKQAVTSKVEMVIREHSKRKITC